MVSIRVQPGSQQEQDIVNLYLEGKSLDAISKIYGFSISTAHNTLKRAGVKCRAPGSHNCRSPDGLTAEQRFQKSLREDPVKHRKVRDNQYAARLKRVYNIPFEDYLTIAAYQNGKCDICKNFPKKGRRLHVDHCHETGRIRGLLCDTCNLALGYFYDNPETMKEAARYIETRLPELGLQ